MLEKNKKIEFLELLEFIKKESEDLIKTFGRNSSQKEIILARAVKMNEEVGELCNEVLAFQGDQRDEKLEKHSQSSLENEFADVVITTLLLAESMEVDIQKALKNKIKKILERFHRNKK